MLRVISNPRPCRQSNKFLTWSLKLERLPKRTPRQMTLQIQVLPLNSIKHLCLSVFMGRKFFWGEFWKTPTTTTHHHDNNYDNDNHNHRNNDHRNNDHHNNDHHNNDHHNNNNNNNVVCWLYACSFQTRTLRRLAKQGGYHRRDLMGWNTVRSGIKWRKWAILLSSTLPLTSKPEKAVGILQGSRSIGATHTVAMCLCRFVVTNWLHSELSSLVSVSSTKIGFVICKQTWEKGYHFIMFVSLPPFVFQPWKCCWKRRNWWTYPSWWSTQICPTCAKTSTKSQCGSKRIGAMEGEKEKEKPCPTESSGKRSTTTSEKYK